MPVKLITLEGGNQTEVLVAFNEISYFYTLGTTIYFCMNNGNRISFEPKNKNVFNGIRAFAARPSLHHMRLKANFIRTDD